MKKGSFAHDAWRRCDASSKAYMNLIEFGIDRFQNFSGGLLSINDLGLEMFEGGNNRRDGVFARSGAGDIAPHKFVGIDIPNQRAQGVEVFAAREGLIVFFDKWHGHGNPTILNRKSRIG